MRALMLSFCVALSGCAFIDDFDSFHQPDGGTSDAGSDGGTHTDAGGDAGIDSGVCTAPSMVCDAVCTDVRSDPAHCGSCTHPCMPREACIGSTCTPNPVVQIAAGNAHACAVRTDGTVVCWGSNDYGQLGDGTMTGHDTPAPVVDLPGPIVQVVCGDSHTCARTTTGQVVCWGSNVSGELGNGASDGAPRPTPQLLGSALPPVTHLAAGYSVTCAITPPDNVFCWGTNAYGTLGVPPADRTSSELPLMVTTGAGITPDGLAVGSYFEYVCFSEAGGVICWGDNNLNEVPGGSGSPVAPTPILTSIPLHHVTAGGGHLCAEDDMGTPQCWGQNDYGQLGRGTETTSEGIGQPVAPPMAVRSSGPGRDHTCWVDALGTNDVYCTGANAQGQLGMGGMTGFTFNTPQHVMMITNAASVVSGDAFSCALTSPSAGSRVLCWGSNSSGQCGSGDSGVGDPRHLSPVAVTGL